MPKTSMSPVTYAEASEARKTQASAMSSGRPSRRSGISVRCPGAPGGACRGSGSWRGRRSSVAAEVTLTGAEGGKEGGGYLRMSLMLTTLHVRADPRRASELDWKPPPLTFISHDTCALDISLGRRLSKERLLRAVSVRRDIDSEPGTAAFSGHHRLQSTGLDPMQDGPPAHPDRVGRVLRREPALRCRPRHYLPHGRPEPDAPGRPGRHLVADEQPVAQPAKHGEVADAELLRRLQGGVDRLRALRERGLVL